MLYWTTHQHRWFVLRALPFIRRLLERGLTGYECFLKIVKVRCRLRIKYAHHALLIVIRWVFRVILIYRHQLIPNHLSWLLHKLGNLIQLLNLSRVIRVRINELYLNRLMLDRLWQLSRRHALVIQVSTIEVNLSAIVLLQLVLLAQEPLRIRILAVTQVVFLYLFGYKVMILIKLNPLLLSLLIQLLSIHTFNNIKLLMVHLLP